jgi:hypothetical protein
MPRAYLSGHSIEWPTNRWRSREIFDFDSRPERALYWTTREEANRDCTLFNRGIEIPSSEGGMYILRNFKVEKRTSDEFVIVCEGPFIPRQRVAG